MPPRWQTDQSDGERAVYSRLRGEGWSPRAARAWTRQDHPSGPILQKPSPPAPPPQSALEVITARLQESDCRVGLLERELSELRVRLQECGEEKRLYVAEAEREAINAATAISSLSAKLDAERKRADEAETFARAAAQEASKLSDTATELVRLLLEA